MSKMMTMMICTYNGEKNIEEVINSIATQKDYDKYVEEIIVVDNASKDSTKDIVFRLKEKISNLTYVYEGRPGVAFARQNVERVTTKWTCFVDDDNVLMEDWIVNTVEFIEKNPKVGVINCNSISRPDFPISQEQKYVLKALLPSIACTHLSVEELNAGVPSMINSAFGAGMCFLSDPVVKMAKAGWTKNQGRTGDGLGSGEDGEIAQFVLNEGYEYGYNKKSSFSHVVPEKRIKPEYILGLRKGLAIGTYKFLSDGNNYILKRIRLLLSSFKNIIIFPFKYLLEKEEWKKIDLKMTLSTSLWFIGYICKDFLFIRRKES